MIYVGTVCGLQNLKLLNMQGRPNSFPDLGDGKKLVCGTGRKHGEDLHVCSSLSDMQYLWDEHVKRSTSYSINFYEATDPHEYLK